jgi:YVTN family beta-propeller protein
LSIEKENETLPSPESVINASRRLVSTLSVNTATALRTTIVFLGILLGLSALYFGSGIGGAHADSVIGAPIPVGNFPMGIAFDPANSNLYVTNSGSDTVSVISGQTNTVIGAPIPVGHFPSGIAFSPLFNGHIDVFGGTLYVANLVDDTVSVISGRTNTVIGAPIHVGGAPHGIAYDSANGNLYVVNGGSRTVSVISGQNNQVISTIAGPGDGLTVGGITYDSANGNLYVVNGNTDTVSVISGQTNSVIKTIPVGNEPADIAFDYANGNLYVTNRVDDTVSVISGQTNSVIKTIPVGGNPWGIAYDSANGNLYVANFQGSTVSVIDPRHTTSLTLAVASNIPLGLKATISGKLTDVDTAAGIGVASKSITFTTSNGSPIPASVTTASDGSYKTSFTASNTIFNGWNIQAHFAGDSLHNAASSSVHSYNTTKHVTSLPLVISPTSVVAGGTYSVSGTLTDHSAAVPLASKTITFTSTSPITIHSTTTTSTGQYSVSGLTAPTTAGTYGIQAHFAGDALHSAVNSHSQPLKVLTTAAPTTTG